MDGQIDERFICAKVVDRSLLRQGFTLPVKMLYEFKSWFGSLQPGTSRNVTIRLDDVDYAVKLGNRGFDRLKWPDHPEMYQMRYSENSDFAKALQRRFKTSKEYIWSELAKFGQASKRHINLPVDIHEQLLFYRTENPNVWEAEVLTASESATAVSLIKTLDEHMFESAKWTDINAGIMVKPAVVKIRRLDRTIGNNLKRIYGHRCQICGQQVAERYATHVDEVHHIDPFVVSLRRRSKIS